MEDIGTALDSSLLTVLVLQDEKDVEEALRSEGVRAFGGLQGNNKWCKGIEKIVDSAPFVFISNFSMSIDKVLHLGYSKCFHSVVFSGEGCGGGLEGSHDYVLWYFENCHFNNFGVAIRLSIFDYGSNRAIFYKCKFNDNEVAISAAYTSIYLKECEFNNNEECLRLYDSAQIHHIDTKFESKKQICSVHSNSNPDGQKTFITADQFLAEYPPSKTTLHMDHIEELGVMHINFIQHNFQLMKGAFHGGVNSNVT
eukprot:TRINITY_DN12092_c0_g1_i1.p1 TRINITY_DN12092_c0_g1~~TRINITY_DN12092_c0_g1_i1.p1  ORF type:complete len:254 (+),score=48.20 TRINITY_DN12092_c0_g1_i1:607-1368(+)